MPPQKPIEVYFHAHHVPLEWTESYPSSAAEAFRLGLGKYYDGKKCLSGHYSLKNQSGGKGKGCVACSQIKQREKTRNERKRNGTSDYSLADFIREASEKHGDYYSYELISEFRNKTDKYWIRCPVEGHEDFYMQAAKHLAGQGCTQCRLKAAGHSLRLSQEEFLRRCQASHADKYDYSRTVYSTAHDNVTVVCKIAGHGSFVTEANNFMRGLSGCRLCAALATSRRCRHSRGLFVQKAQEKHGMKRYRYHLVNYINSKVNVKIFCTTAGHGVFEQAPRSHLSGSGCPRCAELARAEAFAISMDDFLRRSREKHGDRYDYSRVKLAPLCGGKSRGHSDVEIVCKIHGTFFQSPLAHFRSGCRRCHMEYLWNEVRAISREEWILRSHELHGNRYDYSRVHDFTKVLDEVVTIVCPINGHGPFRQGARVHLAGSGCQKCGDLNRGRDGYRAFLVNELWAESDAELYLVEAFSQYYKFGIAVNFTDRARGHYTEVFYRRQLPRAVAWAAEQYLLLATAWAAPGSLPPDVSTWGGSTELRNKDFDPLDFAEEIDGLVDLIRDSGWKRFCEDNLLA